MKNFSLTSFFHLHKSLKNLILVSLKIYICYLNSFKKEKHRKLNSFFMKISSLYIYLFSFLKSVTSFARNYCTRITHSSLVFFFSFRKDHLFIFRYTLVPLIFNIFVSLISIQVRIFRCFVFFLLFIQIKSSWLFWSKLIIL
jgi:hypothetical protein